MADDDVGAPTNRDERMGGGMLGGPEYRREDLDRVGGRRTHERSSAGRAREASSDCRASAADPCTRRRQRHRASTLAICSLPFDMSGTVADNWTDPDLPSASLVTPTRIVKGCAGSSSTSLTTRCEPAGDSGDRRRVADRSFHLAVRIERHDLPVQPIARRLSRRHRWKRHLGRDEHMDRAGRRRRDWGYKRTHRQTRRR